MHHNSFFTMARSLKGDFPDLVVMKKRQGIIAVALFSIYMILILFTALSILISIMSESYAKVDGNEEIMAECANGSCMTMYWFMFDLYEEYSNLMKRRLLEAAEAAQVISFRVIHKPTLSLILPNSSHKCVSHVS